MRLDLGELRAEKLPPPQWALGSVRRSGCVEKLSQVILSGSSTQRVVQEQSGFPATKALRSRRFPQIDRIR